MNKKVFIGLGLALIGIEVGRFTSLMDKVSFNTKNVKINMEGKNLVLVFQVEVTNNSSKNILVENINGKLFVGEQFVATYGTRQQQVVSANNTSILPITAILSNDDLAKTIPGLNVNTIELTLKTNATIGFKVLGLLEVPVKVKDETTIQAGGIVRELNSYIKKWIDLFKK